jgi:hypothetical protein
LFGLYIFRTLAAEILPEKCVETPNIRPEKCVKTPNIRPEKSKSKEEKAL